MFDPLDANPRIHPAAPGSAQDEVEGLLPSDRQTSSPGEVEAAETQKSAPGGSGLMETWSSQDPAVREGLKVVMVSQLAQQVRTSSIRRLR